MSTPGRGGGSIAEDVLDGLLEGCQVIGFDWMRISRHMNARFATT